jgi:hypothetical protein
MFKTSNRRPRRPWSAAVTLAMALALAVTAALLGQVGCGGSQKGAAASSDDQEFQCKNRRIAYIVTGSFAGPEVGVVVDCAERGPRIMKWVVLSEQGDRQTMEHSLTSAEFDDLWKRIESTGWRNLGDCDNPDAVEGDPEYKIGVQDDVMNKSMACTGKELPFPFNRMVNELDLKAAEYSE